MINHLIYFFIGISLSLDAFTIAISIGGLINSNNKRLLISLIVGTFHFIMPNLGNIIGRLITKRIILNTRIINFIIFSLLGIGMIIDKEKEENLKVINLITIIIIGITVSLDSLTVGIALGITSENIMSAGIIFSITSFIFTYLGLITGKKIKDNYYNKSDYFGITLIFLIAIKYLLFG